MYDVHDPYPRLVEVRLPSPFNRNGFASTCWTRVRACAQEGQVGEAARESFCRSYWYPLYAYIRRKGNPGYDAEDLTQAFFADILGRPWFASADPARGKFRSFFLKSADHFLHLVFKRKRALKRGGIYTHIPLNTAEAEPRFYQSASACVHPTEVNELQWASAIVSTAIRRLEAEYATAGKLAVYEHLRTYLAGGGDARAYEAAAAVLGISAGNIKVAVHRLRKRYGAILRDEVGRTVNATADVEAEMRHVRAVLAGI